ncbi:MAG: hypothetical protein QN141_12740 [Armatimonadota bacterium]|nr:hypothetical protein [Armatimonadota bacterium]MDR7452519.1 hypothetical protein [Armatimonadota bacterium]MDR7467746.1 hypothetical protein [Armatimonadota bacterium]MDR7494946.1 hypothetical protein [Armatimonadota bacterium]MDR7499789.1 hypothetical protein [Armatimonadota bacterium]
MDSLRRLGGEAGLVAGVATAWIFLGFVFIFPTAGLDYVDQVNPHRYLPFVIRHPAMVWAVHILGGLLAAFGTAVLFAALQDRFGSDAPGTARLGAAAGLFGAGTLAAAVLVRQAGFDALAGLYATNAVGGATAFYALRSVVASLESLSALASGVGILLLGRLMVADRRFQAVGYLSVGAGAIMIFAAFVSHVFLFMLSTVAMIAWLLWSSLTLRAEAGPAFLTRWHTSARKRRANGARRTA